MQKKFVKIVLGVIGIAMVCIIVYFLLSRVIPNPFKGKNVITQKLDKNSSGEDTDTHTADAAQGQIPYSEVVGVLPYQKNTEILGKPFTVEGDSVEICVNEAAFTKEEVDSDAVWDAIDDDTYPYEFDDEYNILNDFTYVVVNVTVKNLGSAEKEFYMNTFHYLGVDTENRVKEQPFYCGQMRGYKTRADMPDKASKSYAQTILPAGDEITCNLVFIQKDTDIEGKIPYIRFSPSGSSDPEDEFTRYVKLKE